MKWAVVAVLLTLGVALCTAGEDPVMCKQNPATQRLELGVQTEMGFRSWRVYRGNKLRIPKNLLTAMRGVCRFDTTANSKTQPQSSLPFMHQSAESCRSLFDSDSGCHAWCDEKGVESSSGDNGYFCPSTIDFCCSFPNIAPKAARTPDHLAFNILACTQDEVLARGKTSSGSSYSYKHKTPFKCRGRQYFQVASRVNQDDKGFMEDVKNGNDPAKKKAPGDGGVVTCPLVEGSCAFVDGNIGEASAEKRAVCKETCELSALGCEFDEATSVCSKAGGSSDDEQHGGSHGAEELTCAVDDQCLYEADDALERMESKAELVPVCRQACEDKPGCRFSEDDNECLKKVRKATRPPRTPADAGASVPPASMERACVVEEGSCAYKDSTVVEAMATSEALVKNCRMSCDIMECEFDDATRQCRPKVSDDGEAGGEAGDHAETVDVHGIGDRFVTALRNHFLSDKIKSQRKASGWNIEGALDEAFVTEGMDILRECEPVQKCQELPWLVDWKQQLEMMTYGDAWSFLNMHHGTETGDGLFQGLSFRNGCVEA